MKNNIIILGALGVGAYLLLKGKLGGSGERMFTLPNGQRVPESQLSSLGYVQYQGQWYPASSLQPPNVPAGTSPTSTTWLSYVNAALQTGQQLIVLGGSLGEQIARTIKSTAVDWNNSNVTVKLVYGYLTWNGDINPTTSVNKTYQDQAIIISGNGQDTTIKFTKAGQVQKTATINFYNEKLLGFDAGSVGITGIYIGSADNIDTVTNIYGVGALKGKGRKIDTYKYWILNLDTYRVVNGYTNRAAAENAVEVDYDNSIVITTKQMKEMGVSDPRQGIGSVYPYNHPKGLTHCQDGTYSDSHKGACSYHGGAHEIKLRKGSRDYSGKGSYEHYASYRKQYKNKWAKQNRYSDRVTTL